MKVFISWSGPSSRSLAELLSEWIPDVLQEVECFYSNEDIRAGARWLTVVNEELSNTSFGVLCVTPQNKDARWLLFEAGALANKIGTDSLVVPITMGFSPGALELPLSQFNGVGCDKTGIHKMFRTIWETAGRPRGETAFERTFEQWWVTYHERLERIEASLADAPAPVGPSADELLKEILSTVRGIARGASKEPPSPRSGFAEAPVFVEYTRHGSDGERPVRVRLEGSPGAIRREELLRLLEYPPTPSTAPKSEESADEDGGADPN